MQGNIHNFSLSKCVSCVLTNMEIECLLCTFDAVNKSSSLGIWFKRKKGRYFLIWKNKTKWNRKWSLSANQFQQQYIHQIYRQFQIIPQRSLLYKENYIVLKSNLAQFMHIVDKPTYAVFFNFLPLNNDAPKSVICTLFQNSNEFLFIFSTIFLLLTVICTNLSIFKW